MKVIIVGGGIAGLTFANALEQAGIDFVLLEARPILDPQVGASIGLSPAAMRIYDQFGAAQEILDQTAPLVTAYSHKRDGSLISSAQPIFQLLIPRLGYGISFLDRQLVLRAATNSVHRREKLLVNKRLQSVEHFDSGVKVHCEDGTSFEGDLVVGCDGVNSKVRQEMWRIAAEEEPGCFPIAEKTEKLGAEFRCLFGISQRVPGFDQEGTVDNTYDVGNSFLIITGKECRIYWFFFQKLDKRYKYADPDFPKYTKKDAEEVAEANKHRLCHGYLTLGDIWEKRVSYTLVPMEEGLFDKWSWNRIATIGDNAHKMTANHGQAGNNAIESAAALANQLRALNDSSIGPPSTSNIRSAFQKWQAKHQVRIEATCKEAALICRMHSLDNLAAYIFNFLVVPLLGDILINLQTDNMLGAELLEWLPVPERSLKGSMPFNPEQGVGKKEWVIARAIRASPLLLIAWFVYTKTGGEHLSARTLTLAQPETTREVESFQDLLFKSSETLFYSIWLIEAARRANRLAVIRVCILVFGMLAQMYGFGVVAPIYFFFHYLPASIANFAAGDMRLTELKYTRTVLPISLIRILIPVLCKLTGRSVSAGGSLWHWSWALSPVFIEVSQRVAIKTGLSKDTNHHDAVRAWTNDLPAIRWCVGGLSAISVLVWALILVRAPGASVGLKCSRLFDVATGEDSLLYWNRMGMSVAGLFWIALLLGADLGRAGMLGRKELSAVALLVVAIGVGVPVPTVVSLGWLLREQTLATKHEKHAVTWEKYSGRSVLEVDGGSAGIMPEQNQTTANDHGQTNGRPKE